MKEPHATSVTPKPECPMKIQIIIKRQGHSASEQVSPNMRFTYKRIYKKKTLTNCRYKRYVCILSAVQIVFVCFFVYKHIAN